MKALLTLLFLLSVSVTLAVEEDEVSLPLPEADPFQTEEVGDGLHVGTLPRVQRMVRLAWSGQEYGVSLFARQTVVGIDLSGDAAISKETDFTPLSRRLLNLRMTVPMRSVWTDWTVCHRDRQGDGIVTEKKSSISTALEAGARFDRWSLHCSGEYGTAQMEDEDYRSFSGGAALRNHHESRLVDIALTWRGEKSKSQSSLLGTIDVSYNRRLNSRTIFGIGVTGADFRRLRLFPTGHFATSAQRIFFRTEFSPGANLAGRQTYLEKDFSKAGDPVTEFRPFRWRADLKWSPIPLFSLNGSAVLEEHSSALIWEWDPPLNVLLPRTIERLERRSVELGLELTFQPAVSWYFNVVFDKSTDDEGYQIANCPLWQARTEAQLSRTPFALSAGAHYCGERFAKGREEYPLDHHLTFFSGLGLAWRSLSFSFRVENINDQRYELFPSTRHRGRRLRLEMAAN